MRSTVRRLLTCRHSISQRWQTVWPFDCKRHPNNWERHPFSMDYLLLFYAYFPNAMNNSWPYGWKRSSLTKSQAGYFLHASKVQWYKSVEYLGSGITTTDLLPGRYKSRATRRGFQFLQINMGGNTLEWTNPVLHRLPPWLQTLIAEKCTPIEVTIKNLHINYGGRCRPPWWVGGSHISSQMPR